MNYLKPSAVTEMTGISESTLAQRRFRSLPPKYLKPTPKTVIYRLEDVLEWLEESERSGTGA